MTWDQRAEAGGVVEVAEEVEVVAILADKTADMLHLQARRGEDRTRTEHQKREEE